MAELGIPKVIAGIPVDVKKLTHAQRVKILKIKAQVSRWPTFPGEDRVSLYYGIDGNPIPVWEWIAAAECLPDSKIVGRTRLFPGILISTVWLGLDHSFSFHENAAPVIFETMVFFVGGGGEDHEMERYCSLSAARVGHAETVKRWRWRRWKFVLPITWDWIRLAILYLKWRLHEGVQVCRKRWR